MDLSFNLVIEAERSDWQSSLKKEKRGPVVSKHAKKNPESGITVQVPARLLTDIANDSARLVRDRHNEDPSTRPGRDIPAPDPVQPSRQANHVSANPYGTSISLWISKALVIGLSEVKSVLGISLRGSMGDVGYVLRSDVSCIMSS